MLGGGGGGGGITGSIRVPTDVQSLLTLNIFYHDETDLSIYLSM